MSLRILRYLLKKYWKTYFFLILKVFFHMCILLSSSQFLSLSWNDVVDILLDHEVSSLSHSFFVAISGISSSMRRSQWFSYIINCFWQTKQVNKILYMQVLPPLCAELRNLVMQPMILPMVLTIAESQVVVSLLIRFWSINTVPLSLFAIEIPKYLFGNGVGL